MRYELRLSPTARRNLDRDLPEPVAAAVWEFINGDLLVNPQRVGKQLYGKLEGLWVARRGMYRVVYAIEDQEIVVRIIRISHRADIYR